MSSFSGPAVAGPAAHIVVQRTFHFDSYDTRGLPLYKPHASSERGGHQDGNPSTAAQGMPELDNCHSSLGDLTIHCEFKVKEEKLDDPHDVVQKQVDEETNSRGRSSMEKLPATAMPAVQKGILELDFQDLYRSLRGQSLPAKKAALALLRQQGGVRRLTNGLFGDSPGFALEVLRSVAPTLEEISVGSLSKRHFEAIHAMPRLRRMEVEHVGSLVPSDEQPTTLPALQHDGGLQWLRVEGLPWSALLSLLHAHRASLEVLWLHVDTPKAPKKRYRPLAVDDDLPGLLVRCGLRLSRLVLCRSPRRHTLSSCREQVSAVRRVLPNTLLQCKHCDKLEMEPF